MSHATTPGRTGRRPRWHRSRTCAFLLLILTALIPSCDQPASTQTAPGAALTHEQTAESGPLAATLTVTPLAPTVADRVRLTLTVEQPESVRIEWPEIEPALGENLTMAREQRREPVRLDGQRVRSTRLYTLEPDLPGETTIGALEIGWRRDDPATNGALQLNAVALTVRSLLEDEAAADVAPRKGVVEPPPPLEQWLLLGAAGALLIAAFILLAVLLIRRALRRDRSTPPLSPHEAALLALHRLEQRDLLGAGMQEEFLERLSDILRRYIEGRFGLDAPHRTTEEFLRDARRSPVLPAEDAGQIGRFLRQVDLVKFAREHVTRHQAEEALAMVRSFVARTRPVVEHGNGQARTPRRRAAEEATA